MADDNAGKMGSGLRITPLRFEPLTTELPDFRAVLAERLGHWRKVSCSTEPVDRAVATEVICALYQAIGKPRPTVLFFPSPMMCMLATKRLFPGQRPRPLWRRLRVQLWHQFEEQFWARLNLQRAGPWRHMDNGAFMAIREPVVDFASLVEIALRRQVMLAARRRPTAMLRGRWSRQVERELCKPVAHEHGARGGSGERARQIKALGGELEGWIRSQPDSLIDPFTGEHVVYENLDRQIWAGDALENSCAGAWWRGWFIFHDCMAHAGVSYPPQLQALLQLWVEQSQQCHWWFPYQHVVLASERPSAIHFDERDRLHHETGAALEYRDGFSLHSWHGVLVKRHVITDPGSIRIKEVERESNAEARRILIERYGWKRFMKDCGAEVIDSVPEDHPIRGLRGARLLGKTLEGEPEPIVYLEMVNSTPEAGGAAKRYLERIDPKAYDGDAGRYCHAAMASRWRYLDDSGVLKLTFERWQDYQPTHES